MSKKSILEMIKFSHVWSECNNCLKIRSFKLYPADSVGEFCRQEEVNHSKLDPDQDEVYWLTHCKLDSSNAASDIFFYHL